MMLQNLKKSLSEMTTEELHAELTSLRTRRRRSGLQPTQKPKSTSLMKANLDAIGDDGLASLVALLEEKLKKGTIDQIVQIEPMPFVPVHQRQFNVWLEGYEATGNSASAEFKGVWSGITFEEACANWVDSLPIEERSYYDPKTNSYWGCQFYENETAARKTFG